MLALVRVRRHLLLMGALDAGLHRLLLLRRRHLESLLGRRPLLMEARLILGMRMRLLLLLVKALLMLLLGLVDCAGHLHALFLALVALCDWGMVACSEGDFAILLDESAAEAAVGGAAVGAAGALDAVSLANFSSLEHVVEPSKAGEALDTAPNHTLSVQRIVRLQRGIIDAIHGSAMKHAWQKAGDQACLHVTKAIKQAMLPLFTPGVQPAVWLRLDGDMMRRLMLDGLLVLLDLHLLLRWLLLVDGLRRHGLLCRLLGVVFCFLLHSRLGDFSINFIKETQRGRERERDRERQRDSVCVGVCG